MAPYKNSFDVGGGFLDFFIISWRFFSLSMATFSAEAAARAAGVGDVLLSSAGRAFEEILDEVDIGVIGAGGGAGTLFVGPVAGGFGFDIFALLLLESTPLDVVDFADSKEAVSICLLSLLENGVDTCSIDNRDASIVTDGLLDSDVRR